MAASDSFVGRNQRKVVHARNGQPGACKAPPNREDRPMRHFERYVRKDPPRDLFLILLGAWLVILLQHLHVP